MLVRRTILAVGALLALCSPLEAQVIGTFSWQTQPFCNVITVTVIQQGGQYLLVGADNLCGAGSAPVTGTAVPVAGGDVAFGLTVVPSSGRATHIAATISLASLSGSWSEEGGSGGTFAFGGNLAGSARPAPVGPAVTVGNGEGVGGSICTAGGVEMFTKDAAGTLVNARFSFIIPGFANGQIRADGSIRNGSANLISVQHPSVGAYCLVFSNPQPTQLQAESTVASIHAER